MKALSPMNQGEQLAVPLGTGTALIREMSNNSEIEKRPQLLLMSPAAFGVQSDHDSSVLYDTPAQSFEMHYLKVRQLYDLLKTYYGE